MVLEEKFHIKYKNTVYECDLYTTEQEASLELGTKAYKIKINNKECYLSIRDQNYSDILGTNTPLHVKIDDIVYLVQTKVISKIINYLFGGEFRIVEKIKIDNKNLNDKNHLITELFYANTYKNSNSNYINNTSIQKNIFPKKIGGALANTDNTVIEINNKSDIDILYNIKYSIIPKIKTIESFTIDFNSNYGIKFYNSNSLKFGVEK